MCQLAHNREIRSKRCAVSADSKIVFENKKETKETELVAEAGGSTCDEAFRSSQSYLNFSVALSLDESACTGRNYEDKQKKRRRK